MTFKQGNDLATINATVTEVQIQVAALSERIDGNRAITEEQFVRYAAILRGEADKTAIALAASDKAITKAEIATERRFESVNEFRAQLADQATTFLRRDQYDAAHRPLADRLSELVADRALLVRRDFLDAMLQAQEQNFANARAADQALIEQLGKDVRLLQNNASNLQGRLWALGVGLGLVVVIVNVLIKVLG